LRIGWLCLLIVSVSILGFGLVIAIVPMDADELVYRADGLASIGFGLFGALMAIWPYRRRERWAWYAFWLYPVFWMIHLVGQLPPGTDHIHQIVFIILSLIGLLVPFRAFFPARRSARS
jgi:hypothetical protein